jgi:hypothetical protein
VPVGDRWRPQFPPDLARAWHAACKRYTSRSVRDEACRHVLFPEKRKVGGSTPPLTTHYHQRIYACGLRKRRCPDCLTAAPWRPFQTFDARCGPMLGARRVHGCIWLQTTGACQVGTTTAASERCLRSCMRVVVRPCCCTSCCTDLTLTRQGTAVTPPRVTEPNTRSRWDCPALTDRADVLVRLLA